MNLDSLANYGFLALGSLVAVLNPAATVPPFLAMTENNSAAERKLMARRACLVACCILLVFALTGPNVLQFFGISTGAFQIAGGVVLVRVALELLRGSRALKISPEERDEGTDKDDISVTPLAIPILCGPATIATAILVRSQGLDWIRGLILVVIIIAIYCAIFVMLWLASDNAHRMSRISIMISSRLMGLILVAVAVEFILQGLGATLFRS